MAIYLKCKHSLIEMRDHAWKRVRHRLFPFSILTCVIVAKLSTDHHSFIVIPEVITNSSPGLIGAHLNTTLVFSRTINKPEIPIITQTCSKMWLLAQLYIPLSLWTAEAWNWEQTMPMPQNFTRYFRQFDFANCYTLASSYKNSF